MANVLPATFKSRSQVEDKPIYYASSWMMVPFEDQTEMSQKEFQEAIAPYGHSGSSLSMTLGRGSVYRRMESSTMPGKHFYANIKTGAISRLGKEYYDTVRECWCNPDGTRISEAELAMGPEARALATALRLDAEAQPASKSEAQEEEKEEKEKEKEKEPKKASMAIEDVAEPLPRSVSSEPKLPVALIFPGQGSQYVKMLSAVKELPAVKAMLTKASLTLGFDLLELCLKGPESKLELTKYCQPAMYIGGLAGVERLRVDRPEKVERCQAVAGLSLGEYVAMTVAQVWDFETGMEVVKVRGEAMQEAAEAHRQSMLSVAGLSRDRLSELCEECRQDPGDVCQIANYLFPNGFSVAGSASAVERLMSRAQKTEGCLQAKLLKTLGAFHTPLMESARVKLLKKLQSVEHKMRPPTCDVYMNVTGTRITPKTSVKEIITLLSDQMVNCVQWAPSVREMISDGIGEYYECGPMKQLKAMMKRIDPAAFKLTTTIDV